MTENTQDREIVISRIVDAPRELVFKVWTDPQHIAEWWGPNGFTNTIHEMEVRPGGVWRFTMHGPDGKDYHDKIVYLEIVEPELLVYDHSEDVPGSPDVFRSIITFEELDGKTKVTMKAIFKSAQERERQSKFGAVEGGQQTLEKMAAFVMKQK